MGQQVTNLRLAGDGGLEVISFEGGVVAYGPAEPDGYWRLRWLELGRRRDTTARTRDEALAKAVELSSAHSARASGGPPGTIPAATAARTYLRTA